jgi:hypothetical protein
MSDETATLVTAIAVIVYGAVIVALVWWNGRQMRKERRR